MRFVSAFCVVALAACGGSGKSGDMTLPADLSHPPPPDLQSRIDLAVAPMGPNVVPLIVDGFGFADVAYGTLEVCAPGTTTCVTVDHVSVDTGSVGLRIVAEALGQDFLSELAPNPSLGECYTYVSSYVFGSVQKADVKIGGETAANLPFLLIGDPALPNVPAACQTTNVETDTIDSFGSKGIIGVGVTAADCGTDCALSSHLGHTNPAYYDCTDPTKCIAATVATADQVPNPVSVLPVDNNGVSLEFPAVPELGAATLTGYLYFGIGTQDNNGLGDADVFALSSANFDNMVNVAYGGHYYQDGFFDSGTSALIYPDTTIPACGDTGAACPPSTIQLEAELLDFKNHQHYIHFRVENGDQILMSGNSALDGLAYTQFTGDFFDIGFPFFIGRRIYSAIGGAQTPAGPGPFWAVY